MTIILECGVDTENLHKNDDNTIILCEQRIYSPTYVDTVIVKYEDSYYLLVVWADENGSNWKHQIIIQGELSTLNDFYISMSNGCLDLGLNNLCYKWKHFIPDPIFKSLKMKDFVELLNADSDTTE